jgi:hypothetical protein
MWVGKNWEGRGTINITVRLRGCWNFSTRVTYYAGSIAVMGWIMRLYDGRFSLPITEQAYAPADSIISALRKTVYTGYLGRGFPYCSCDSMASVCERTIPKQRPPLVGEVSANFLLIEGATWSAWRIPTPYSRFSRPEPLLFRSGVPQLYSRGWVDPVPDPLLLRKSDVVILPFWTTRSDDTFIQDAASVRSNGCELMYGIARIEVLYACIGTKM